MILSRSLLRGAAIYLNKWEEDITLDDLSAVKKLIIDPIELNNKYEAIDLNELKYFNNLETLEISNMRITSSISNYLSHLKRLKVYKCNIESINLNSLEHLYMCKSNIEDINSLANLTNLIKLHIIGMDLDNDDFLNSMRSLKLLDLTNSNIFNINNLMNLKLDVLSLVNSNIEYNDEINTLKRIYINNDKKVNSNIEIKGEEDAILGGVSDE